MKQLSLFEIDAEEFREELNETEKAEPKQEIDYKKFVVCPKCKVLPIVSRSKPCKTIDGWSARKYIAYCPVCGYEVADYYDIYEHWNKCNYYRVRDGKV